MPLLRKPETQARYSEYRAGVTSESLCIFCTRVPLQTFRLWKIVENYFPYDLIVEVHHLLTPIRHVKLEELTNDEIAELVAIKRETVSGQYDYMIENTPKRMTEPDHFHLHLMREKK